VIVIMAIWMMISEWKYRLPGYWGTDLWGVNILLGFIGGYGTQETRM
jgi:hypothetical protein